MATTIAVAVIAAKRARARPGCAATALTAPLKAASPTMPLMMPMEVMPTCTVDRNWVGCSSSLSAACAPPSPASAMAASRALRVEASAISDMANRPLSSVSSAISRKSMNQDRIASTGLYCNATCPKTTLDRVLWSDMQREPAPGELPLLAHYTSIRTLERIAQTGEIWFSNPLYMNDVDELRYGMNLGLHAVRSPTRTAAGLPAGALQRAAGCLRRAVHRLRQRFGLRRVRVQLRRARRGDRRRRTAVDVARLRRRRQRRGDRVRHAPPAGRALAAAGAPGAVPVVRGERGLDGGQAAAVRAGPAAPGRAGRRT